MKVFFDVDGVIIEGWHARPERRKPWDETLEQDLGISREALQRAIFLPPRPGAESLMGKCVRGEIDLKETLSEVLPTLGYTGSVEAFVEYWFRKDSKLDQEVLQVVKHLGRCDETELYLATNQEHHRATYLWHDLGLKDLFDDIFYSARMGVLKDRRDFFANVNAQLSTAGSERPLFFDDREEIVMTARAAGWDAHVFNTVEDLTRNSRLLPLLRNQYP